MTRTRTRLNFKQRARWLKDDGAGCVRVNHEGTMKIFDSEGRLRRIIRCDGAQGFYNIHGTLIDWKTK